MKSGIAFERIKWISLIFSTLDGKVRGRRPRGVVIDALVDLSTVCDPRHDVPHDHQGIHFQTKRWFDRGNLQELTSGTVVLRRMLMGMPGALQYESANSKKQQQAYNF